MKQTESQAKTLLFSTSTSSAPVTDTLKILISCDLYIHGFSPKSTSETWTISDILLFLVTSQMFT